MPASESKEFPLRVGVSSCLLGEMVRFDGGHKKGRYLSDILGSYFEWVPVCPELEVGMGVPREAVRLVGSSETPLSLVLFEFGADILAGVRVTDY